MSNNCTKCKYNLFCLSQGMDFKGWAFKPDSCYYAEKLDEGDIDYMSPMDRIRTECTGPKYLSQAGFLY